MNNKIDDLKINLSDDACDFITKAFDKVDRSANEFFNDFKEIFAEKFKDAFIEIEKNLKVELKDKIEESLDDIETEADKTLSTNSDLECEKDHVLRLATELVYRIKTNSHGVEDSLEFKDLKSYLGIF